MNRFSFLVFFVPGPLKGASITAEGDIPVYRYTAVSLTGTAESATACHSDQKHSIYIVLWRLLWRLLCRIGKSAYTGAY